VDPLALAIGRSLKSKEGRRQAAADFCFQRGCLQSNGSQLAIRPALLLATSGAGTDDDKRLATSAMEGSRPTSLLSCVRANAGAPTALVSAAAPAQEEHPAPGFCS